jgi:hypothetical protein
MFGNLLGGALTAFAGPIGGVVGKALGGALSGGKG